MAALDAAADSALRMTGPPFIGLRPSARKSVKPFQLICFYCPSFSARQSRPRALAAFLKMRLGWEKSEGLRNCSFRSRRSALSPPVSGLRGFGASGLRGSRPGRALPPPPRGAPEAAGPAHVAGGPEREAGRPPHNGGQGWPSAPPPPRAPRAPEVPEGSRTGLLGGGRGAEERRKAAVELLGPRRVPHTLPNKSTQSFRSPLETNGP